MWSIRDPKLPFWQHKIRGDDMPSSLTFVSSSKRHFQQLLTVSCFLRSSERPDDQSYGLEAAAWRAYGVAMSC